MRNFVFDLLRIILMIFIINVHIRIITGVQPNLLYSFTWFTVPLFIIMSFFFFHNNNLEKRINRLIVPFIFWSLAAFLVHPDLLNTKNVLLQLVTGQLINTPLYYLVLLILFTIINWFIYKFFPKHKIPIYLLITLIAFYLEYSKINYNFFFQTIRVIQKTYGRFFELIPYVPAGLAFGYLNKKIKNIYFILLSLLFLVFYIISTFIPQPPDFHFSGLIIFFGSSAIFSFFLWMSKIRIANRLTAFISYLGKYTFGVYLCHYLIIELLIRNTPVLRFFVSLHEIFFLLIIAFVSYTFCIILDFLTLGKLSLLVE